MRGGEPGRLAILAGVNREKTGAGILAGNYASAADGVRIAVSGLPWEGTARFEVRVVDAERELTPVQEGSLPAGGGEIRVDLKAPAVCLVKIVRP